MSNIFDEAVEAGVNYIHSAIRTRADKYRFLALAYLGHQQGQQDRQGYDEWITSRLHRGPSKRERERPFLRVLHALLNKELVRQYRPQYTNMAYALERIAEEFERTATVTVDGVIEFLTENGGVSGLYRRREERSLESETDTATLPRIPVEKAADATGAKTRGQRKGGKPRAPQSRVAAGTNQGPGHDAPEGQDPQDERIEIANLGAWVITDGEDTRLKVSAFGPGKHIIHMEVGQDGFVEDWEERIISEDEDAVQLQPPVCPTGSSEASTRH